MNKVYFNDMQMEVLSIGAHDSVVVGGRGIGKGPVHAAVNLRNFQSMPGSTTAFVAPNGKRALTNTLPSMFQHWEDWGYKRGLHWVCGQKPPKNLHWAEPLIRPENYDNVISFYTGAIGVIISQDRIGTSNSKSFDFIDIDEAKFIDFDRLKDETFQANRGQIKHFGHCPWHHGMLVTSDMPVTKKGSWFLEYEKKSTPDIIDAIRGMIGRRYELQQELQSQQLTSSQRTWREKEIQSINDYLHTFRSKALFYKEYSSLVNLAVLGEGFIKQQKRDLPLLTFQTSILCKRISILRDGFYGNMREVHKYSSTNYHTFENIGYDFDRLKDDSRLDGDCDTLRPLCIAFDFNSNINWLVCGQPDYTTNELRTLKSFYVKYERKLEALCEDFSNYYKYHINRDIIFYHDHTALGSNYAVNKEDFKWVICNKLKKLGWRVRPVYIGRAMGHLEKHMLIARGFAGRGGLMPMFNRENNEDLLISIQTAGIYNGKKDKRGEKLAETPEDQLQGRTDGSDAWDTLYIGCTKFPQKTYKIKVTSGLN